MSPFALPELRRLVEEADPGVAIDALRPAARALAAEHGAEFRELVGRLPAESWEHDALIAAAMGASYRAAGSPRGSSAIGYFHAAAAALADADRSRDPERVAVWLAHAAALRTLGRLDAAQEYVQRVRDLDGPGSILSVPLRVELGARTMLESGMLELHRGDVDAARRSLQFAHGLAAEHLTRAERIECLGGLALVEYIECEFAAAARHIADAIALADGTTLEGSGYLAPALLAEVLVAIDRHDLTTADGVESRMLAAAEGTDHEPMAFIVAGYLRLAGRDLAGGMDFLQRARQSYRPWDPPGMGLNLEQLLRAAILVYLDQGDEAWAILRDLPVDDAHVLCPARVVAQLRLHHGDLAGAALALEACERLDDDHSPRTMIEVRLLRSAIELERGDLRISDAMMDRALVALARTGTRAALRTIPPGTLAALTARASTRPQGAEVARILARIAEATEGFDRLIEPLSSRELLVLAEVEKGSTVGEIAGALFISPNTVKTHLRRLYRKLGVATRSEAVRKARALGLGRRITP